MFVKSVWWWCVFYSSVFYNLFIVYINSKQTKSLVLCRSRVACVFRLVFIFFKTTQWHSPTKKEQKISVHSLFQSQTDLCGSSTKCVIGPVLFFSCTTIHPPKREKKITITYGYISAWLDSLMCICSHGLVDNYPTF